VFQVRTCASRLWRTLEGTVALIARNAAPIVAFPKDRFDGSCSSHALSAGLTKPGEPGMLLLRGTIRTPECYGMWGCPTSSPCRTPCTDSDLTTVRSWRLPHGSRLIPIEMDLEVLPLNVVPFIKLSTRLGSPAPAAKVGMKSRARTSLEQNMQISP